MAEAFVVPNPGAAHHPPSTHASLKPGFFTDDSKKPFFTGDYYYLHTLIVVRVFDGETFSLLTTKAASIGQPTFMAIIRGPHREIDESFWPASPDVAVQNVKLRDAVRELVAQSLDATLPELKLTE